MLGKPMGGKHKCFVCGEEIRWETEYKGYPGSVYGGESAPAEGSALGRMPDGAVVFEIACKCPKCKAKNKFRAERHL